ncbi:MAG TPA: ComF family protein [Polyangiaceae bacterium]
MSRLASVALDLVAAFLAPPRCAACDGPVPRIAVFCAACASTVQRAEDTGDPDAIAAFVYGGAIADAITRFKYGARPDLARPLSHLLWRAVAGHAPRLSKSVVVPVPLHPSRLAERGFNQSALLARPLARRLGAPFLPLALARMRDTPRQASLGRQDRLGNVGGAFAARQPERMRGRPVLLVDDVRTTGATLAACARAALESGAGPVVTAVLAHAT